MISYKTLFDPLIDETLTSISINANTIAYVDENGTTTNLDLSPYIDDTNLARLVSGTVNASGIATFTRDDASTFTVDMSVLLDGTVVTKETIDALGIDADTVNGKTVETSVPLGAVFTDTVYDDTDVVKAPLGVLPVLDGSQLTGIISPVTSVAGKTGVVTLAKGDVGLSNVDNTSDIDKPISTATQIALDDKASTALATTSSNGLMSSTDKTALDTAVVQLVDLELALDAILGV